MSLSKTALQLSFTNVHKGEYCFLSLNMMSEEHMYLTFQKGVVSVVEVKNLCLGASLFFPSLYGVDVFFCLLSSRVITVE